MVSRANVTTVEVYRVSDASGARDYVRWLAPVAARNGVDVLQAFEVTATPVGSLEANLLVFSSGRSEEAFTALASDAEYGKRAALRSAVFDQAATIQYAITPLVPGREDLAARLRAGERADWPTMLDLGNVADMPAAREYATWLDGLAARHGVEVLQIFEVAKRLKGNEHTDVLFMLRAREMSAFAATVNDPDYLARVPKRNETFRMPEARRFIVKPLLTAG
jgi:uncharacterized protein (DUF1330 family)